MRKLILVLFVFVFTSCNAKSKVRLIIFNKTGYTIDSLKISDKFYTIKASEKQKILEVEKIEVQDGIPYGLPNAKIQNKKFDNSLIGFCGTGKKWIKKGTVSADIIIKETEKGYKLYWDYHK